MGATVIVDFVSGKFHGTGSETDMGWPPAPSRIFQALVAGAEKGLTGDELDKAREALRDMETADPPIIYASGANEPSDGGHRFVHGKSAAVKLMSGVVKKTQLVWDKGYVYPDNYRVLYRVKDVDAEALDKAASAVSRVGTTQSPATIKIVAEHVDPDSNHIMWVPSEGTSQGLQCWSKGLYDALDARHRAVMARRVAQFPDAYLPRVTYRPSVEALESDEVFEAVFDTPMDIDDGARLIAAASRGSKATVLPVVVTSPRYPRGRVHGVVISGDDAPLTAVEVTDFFETAGVTLNNEGRFPPTAKTASLFDEHVLFSSVIAADLPGGPDDAAEYVQGYVSQRYGVSAVVEVSKWDPRDRVGVVHGYRGTSPFKVTVTFDSPVRGPVFVGVSPNGPAGLMAPVRTV